MKRTLCTTVVIFIISILTACGGGNTPAAEPVSPEEIDYNSFIDADGYFAYTDSAYIFWSNDRLSFLEPTLSTPITPLCSKPNCDHTSEECSSRLETTGIYASNGKLYYLTSNASNELELFSMNYLGEQRTSEGIVNIPTSTNFMSLQWIGNGYLVLCIYDINMDGDIPTTYLFSLDDVAAEPVILFEGERKYADPSQNAEVTWVWIWDNWVMYSAVSSETFSLYGYDTQTGETKTLVENWDPMGTVTVQDDSFYWYMPDEGLHRTNMETWADELISIEPPSEGVFIPYMDDKYIYLLSNDGTQDGGVYSYDGKQLQSLPVDTQGRTLVYAMSTPEYVFFIESAADTCEPVCYLEKSAIANGTAEYIPLRHE